VDLDGSIVKGTCWTAEACENAEPNLPLIAKVNEMYKDHFIVIHTARRHELYYPTIKWLNKHNVRYHASRFEKLPCDTLIDLDAINRVEDL
jgi:hypothetical protein